MNWFCKKYTACQQCRVHFEPAPPHERHPELCPEHRKPVVEREDRILRVLEWAKRHWEELEPKALEDYNKQNQISQAALHQMYNQAMSAPSRSAASDLMGAMNPFGF